MHVQVLGSGSGGNATLVRAGDLHVLLDAGLPLRELVARLDVARVPLHRIDHVVLTHGHLDHARAAGALARKTGARVHCAERLMRNASVRKAPMLATLPVNGGVVLTGGRAESPEAVQVDTVLIPHDAHPTVALRVTREGRAVVLVTDMGRFDAAVARSLRGAEVVILEFNHDRELLRHGPYAPKLKRRVAGPEGHLSNEEASRMLGSMAGPALHTLVLAHLSATNNRPELAMEAATRTLEELGRGDVRVIVASQDEVGANLEV